LHDAVENTVARAPAITTGDTTGEMPRESLPAVSAGGADRAWNTQNRSIAARPFSPGTADFSNETTSPPCSSTSSARMLKDSPVNGTSATIAQRMSGSRAGFLRLPRLPRPESGSLDGPPRPPEVAFFLCRRGVSPSPAASRLFRDPASGSSQRLWMSIVGSSSGDDWKTSRSS